MMETYLRAEKYVGLSSVQSPKPSGDLKIKVLTSTILRTLHLNHMHLLSSVPLHVNLSLPSVMKLSV